MENHAAPRDRLASRSLFLLDIIFVVAAIGQVGVVVIALLGEESISRLTLLLESRDYTLVQLLLVECILLSWINIALGALSLSFTRTSLTTTPGALAHVIVCCFPLACVVHYFTWGRRNVRSVATQATSAAEANFNPR